MSSQTCEVKRIQMNSAQTAAEQATKDHQTVRADYLSCLGGAALGEAALADAQPTIDDLGKQFEVLVVTNELMLTYLGRTAASEGAVSGLTEIANEQEVALQAEIDELKSAIRTEKRKFLDGSPSVSPAVGGFYFTQIPDNKALIAFLSCFGAFLIILSLLIMLNMIPVDYFVRMDQDSRIQLVAIIWVVSIIATYSGFYIFT